MKNSGTHFVNFKDHNAAAADLICSYQTGGHRCISRLLRPI